MAQEPSSGSKSAQATGTSPSSEGGDGAAPFKQKTTIGTGIDFHTPEFNLRDGLDDFSANYRSFQPLGDIITADIRHQMERRRKGAEEHTEARKEAPSGKEATEERVVEPLVSPHPLTIVSQGRILICDEDTKRAIACGKLLTGQGLTCTLLVTKNGSREASSSDPGPLAPREVDAASINGAFGGFSAMVTVKGEQRPFTEWFDREPAGFDLVLDLQSVPSYAGSSLPLGYYAPGPSPSNLDEVVAELSEMKGQFTKPQFTVFRKEQCLHGRSRTRDCRRCLDICPVTAIQTDNKTISFNHYLCQGCGGCALVCPADAVQMAHPSRGEFLSALLNRIDQGSQDFPFSSDLVIIDQDYVQRPEMSGVTEGGRDRRISFPVEQIGYAGLDVMLTALASGADGVIVACGKDRPPKIREALAGQAQIAAAILEGLGMRPDKIRFCEIPSDSDNYDEGVYQAVGFDGQRDNAPMPKMACFDGHDKRNLVRLATQHLSEQSGQSASWFPLPAHSPFGAVTVDARCTLCMACAVACPSGALSAGGDAPRLSFRESACHQCGLCEEACPEGAIHLLPRMLCDLKTAETAAVIREAAPFRCIECGVPFASQSMISRIQEKLAGHWMYIDDRQLRRLRMCRTCRARDALTSQDMKSWNQR